MILYLIPRISMYLGNEAAGGEIDRLVAKPASNQ
jgi:hypothetical protein